MSTQLFFFFYQPTVSASLVTGQAAIQAQPDTLAATAKSTLTGQAAIQESPDTVAVQVITPQGPAGEDERTRRRRKRGLQPDPFDRFPEQDVRAPPPQPMGWPSMPARPVAQEYSGMAGGVSRNMMDPGNMLNNMLGVRLNLQAPAAKVKMPWEVVPDDPAAADMVKRMLRR